MRNPIAEQFSLFRTSFADVMRFTASFERDILRILHEYTVMMQNVTPDKSRLEMTRDLSIFHARYARCRHKLYILNFNVQKAVIAFKMHTTDAEDIEQLVYSLYSDWDDTKNDFTKSLTAARIKWNKYIQGNVI